MLDSGDIAWVHDWAHHDNDAGMGFFYGGLVRRKNLVSTLVQTMTIFAVVSLVWALWGYSLAFAPTVNGFIGDLSKVGLANVGAAPNLVYSDTIPELLFFVYQLACAAITAALIIGAFAERIRFKALLLFIVLWVTFIYAPVAHWVWGDGGWLKSIGVVDFAGGLVVHISAGLSALAAAILIGRRRGIEKSDRVRPSNVPYVILGAAIRRFGWFGFNGGAALGANALAVQVVVNTNMAGAAAAVSWMLLAIRKGKPSAVGICVGAVCGLVAITPAAGFVGVAPAIFIGLVVGVSSNYVASWRASRTRIDDSLDVFAAHGAGGIWGCWRRGSSPPARSTRWTQRRTLRESASIILGNLCHSGCRDVCLLRLLFSTQGHKLRDPHQGERGRGRQRARREPARRRSLCCRLGKFVEEARLFESSATLDCVPHPSGC